MDLDLNAGTLPAENARSGDAVFRKIAWRFMPLLFICYVVAYLDRVNVGFAKLTMLNDLGFSDAAYGIGAGIFFIGYFMAEVPSNLILHRVGARRWIGRIMVTWAIMSAAMAWTHSTTQFYVLRFLLGVAEAGFLPGILLYLSQWFPAHRRGRMVAILMAGNPVSGIIGGAVSGYILHAMNGWHGMAAWQWLFLLEAAPAALLGLVVYFFLTDKVADARWLDAGERAVASAEIAADAAARTHTSIRYGLTGRRVWLLCAILFFIVMGTSTIGFFQPTIIRNSGVKDPLMIGLLATIPYLAALIGMIYAGRSSDRMRERRWHAVVPVLLSVPGFLLCAFGGHEPLIAMIGLTIATASIITSLPMFWALPSSFLGGAGAAAGIALINSTGNLASFVGPALLGWLHGTTHSLAVGLMVVSGCLLIASMMILRWVPADVVNR
ncbi:MFS transporter [Caballeronia novacaledonica]|uniref:MFS transporter n=1 Tax=Caballeronia novacaledonica TaxID=1544861 RepID=A0ACB5QLQ7_9BURK|nr:MFS transporter [Caballeronia novacaledonica]